MKRAPHLSKKKSVDMGQVAGIDRRSARPLGTSVQGRFAPDSGVLLNMASSLSLVASSQSVLVYRFCQECSESHMRSFLPELVSDKPQGFFAESQRRSINLRCFSRSSYS